MTEQIEHEIKLPYDSPSAARQAVMDTGAKPLRPRRLQSDFLLDHDVKPLSDHMNTLRVRFDGDHSYVTFKGKPQLGITKAREELETVVGDASTLLLLFERLGFRIWFRYQKYREEFRHGDLVIAIDESPIGTFIELEGPESDILAMATALKRHSTDFIRDSYLALFRQHCSDTGSPTDHMLFNGP